LRIDGCGLIVDDRLNESSVEGDDASRRRTIIPVRRRTVDHEEWTFGNVPTG